MQEFLASLTLGQFVVIAVAVGGFLWGLPHVLVNTGMRHSTRSLEPRAIAVHADARSGAHFAAKIATLILLMALVWVVWRILALG